LFLRILAGRIVRRETSDDWDDFRLLRGVVLVAWQLDGVHFALGPTMVSTEAACQGLRGLQVLENRPADDLLFGRLIAEQGVEMKLLPVCSETVPDFQGVSELLAKRARWMTVMRAMRPWGHFGLLLLGGCHGPPSPFGSPNITRSRGLLGFVPGLSRSHDVAHRNPGIKQAGLWTKMPLIPLWDAMAFLIWLVSFTRTSIRWRNVDYQLRNGQFVANTDALVPNSSSKSDFLDDELAAADRAFSASSGYRSPYTSHLLAAPTETPAAMLVCSRRSLRGSRQFTCGSMIVGSTRVRDTSGRYS